jgi:carbamoyl-phosphate synthase large subunit
MTTLARRREGLRLIATSSVAHEPALFDWDTVYLAVETAGDPAAFEDSLLDIMARENVDLVIPCRDDDVVFLASLRERRPDLASRLLCGSADAARVIGDKWLSAEFCKAKGLPFAPSIVDGSAAALCAFSREYGFPLVAKPRRGYASQNVFVIFNAGQLERTLSQEGWIVQKFLGDARTVEEYLASIETRGLPLYHTFHGLKNSIQVLIAPDGSTTHVICTRNVNQHRRSKWVEPDSDPRSREIGNVCAAAFSAAGWRGPLNIQCQRDARGEMFIHEFNGRFTGATVDRWLLGFDEVGAAIEQFTGRRVANAQTRQNAALEAFESLVARAADPRHVQSLRRERVWRRAR